MYPDIRLEEYRFKNLRLENLGIYVGLGKQIVKGSLPKIFFADLRHDYRLLVREVVFRINMQLSEVLQRGFSVFSRIPCQSQTKRLILSA